MKHRFMWITVFVGSTALFYVAVPSHSQTTQTPQAQNSAQHSSPTRAQPNVPGPVPFRSADGKIAGWKVAIPGNRPLASPAIAEGRVFVGGGFGSHEFYAYDAVTGKRLWTYQTADDGPTAAVVENGVIAFNSESCELEVITTGGRRLWKKWLGDPLMSMPAMADGKVYMAYPNSRGDKKYYVAAFDVKSGKELWKYPLAAEIITAPVIERDRLYLATVDGSVLSLNRRDGAKMWQESTSATSAPAVWNEQCYFSRRDEAKLKKDGKAVVQQTEVVARRFIAPQASVAVLPATRREADYLDYSKRARSAVEVQSQSLDASVGFSAVSKGAAQMSLAQVNIGQASVHGIWAYQGSKAFIDNGRLFSSMGDRTQSVDPKTGKVLWTRTLRDEKNGSAVESVLTPPSIVNGKAFVGTGSGEVYALSAQTGDVLWKVNIGEPISFQPTVAKGRVYVATNHGNLYCLNTGDDRDDGWLMWGASAAHNGLPVH